MKLIESIKLFPSNLICPDCHCHSGEGGFLYICLNSYTFLCTRCAYAHLEYKMDVKDLRSDEVPDEIALKFLYFQNGGNLNCMKRLMDHPDIEKIRPQMSDPIDVRKEFVGIVYIQYKYYNENFDPLKSFNFTEIDYNISELPGYNNLQKDLEIDINTSTLRNKNEILENNIKKLQIDNQNLHISLEKIQKDNKKGNDKTKRNELLSNEYTQLIEQLNQEKNDLNEIIFEKEIEISNLRKSVENKTLDFNKLFEQNTKVRSEKLELNRTVDKLLLDKTDLNNQIKSMETQNKLLQEILAKSESDKVGLEDNNKKLFNEISNLKRSIETIELENKMINDCNNNIQSGNFDIIKINSNYRTEINDLKQQIDNYENQIDNLNEKIIELETERNIINNKYQSLVENKQGNIQDIENELLKDNIRRLNRETEEYRNDIEQYEIKIQKLNETLTELQNEKNVILKSKHQFETEKVLNNTKMNKLESMKEILTQRTDNYETEINKLKNTNSLLMLDKKKLENKITELNNEIVILNDRIKYQQSDHDSSTRSMNKSNFRKILQFYNNIYNINLLNNSDSWVRKFDYDIVLKHKNDLINDRNELGNIIVQLRDDHINLIKSYKYLAIDQTIPASPLLSNDTVINISKNKFYPINNIKKDNFLSMKDDKINFNAINDSLYEVKHDELETKILSGIKISDEIVQIINITEKRNIIERSLSHYDDILGTRFHKFFSNVISYYNNLDNIDSKQKQELIQKYEDQIDQLKDKLRIDGTQKYKCINKYFQSLLTAYYKEKQLKTLLFNELIEIRGNIRVFCRVRPFLETEPEHMRNYFFQTKDNAIYSTVDEYPKYEFDAVFSYTSTQEEVFREISPYIHSALDGYNLSIFAYGQTGSGKTYTMEGVPKSYGVTFRTIEFIIDASQDNTTYNYEFQISIFEIYNERIIDLTVGSTQKTSTKPSLQLHLSEDGTSYIKDLTRLDFSSFDEAKQLIKSASRNRSTRSHRLNQTSSRSHLILTIYIYRTDKVSNQLVFSRLNFIDLAGSERILETGVTGEGQQEAVKINSSLSALGNVIHSLGEHSKHIPYRNSKLTHILQDSLSYNSKVIMITTIAPHSMYSSESFSTISFGQRCRATELNPLSKQIGNNLFNKITNLMNTIDKDVESKRKQKNIDIINLINSTKDNESFEIEELDFLSKSKTSSNTRSSVKSSEVNFEENYSLVGLDNQKTTLSSNKRSKSHNSKLSNSYK